MGPAGTSGVQCSEGQTSTEVENSISLLPGSPGKPGSAETQSVHKVRIHSSHKKKKKTTALDKQYRYVAALQLRNRQRAAELQQDDQLQLAQQQQLANFSQQLRSTILAGDYDTLQQTWQPAATAARLKDLQQTAAQQTQELFERLSLTARTADKVFDPDTLRSTYSKASTATAAFEVDGQVTPAIAEAATANEDAGDVDAFLDSLLQQATAQKAASKDNKQAASAAQASLAVAGTPDAVMCTSVSRPSTAKSTSGKQHSRLRPAWALTEQQQADSDAAAEAAEETELLEFAEQLDWQELIGKLDDEQLAAAFKELEVADAAVAAGDPSADKHWRASFVTALNHAAFNDVAAAGCSSSTEGDRHSKAPSSASQIRRAEEKAGRRQKLLDRLSRLQGNSSASVLGDIVKGSTAGDRASLFGGSAGLGGMAGGAAAGDWDRSTRAGGDDVQAVQQQLKVLEASEVLAENPEMKGVHSVASIKSMLQKKDVQ